MPMSFVLLGDFESVPREDLLAGARSIQAFVPGFRLSRLRPVSQKVVRVLQGLSTSLHRSPVSDFKGLSCRTVVV